VFYWWSFCTDFRNPDFIAVAPGCLSHPDDPVASPLLNTLAMLKQKVCSPPPVLSIPRTVFLQFVLKQSKGQSSFGNMKTKSSYYDAANHVSEFKKRT